MSGNMLRRIRVALGLAVVATVISSVAITPASAAAGAPIFNRNSWSCMGTLWNEVVEGIPVTQEYCTGESNQDWILPPVGHWGEVRLGGLCLATVNGNTADGTNIFLWGCNGNPDQQWFYYDSGNYCMVFYNGAAEWEGSSKVLDVAWSSLEPEASVILWPVHGGDNQWWC